MTYLDLFSGRDPVARIPATNARVLDCMAHYRWLLCPSHLEHALTASLT